MKRRASRVTMIVIVGLVLGACSETSFSSMGSRSSGWINAPIVVTTTLPPTTVPVVTDSSTLQWANEDIQTLNLDDPEALVAEVFQRREGDRFIQASRSEIAAALPGVSFPAVVPSSAQWVSSQLVIENSGELSSDPSAAFGIWSAEPYTRSRSVAQLATLAISNDAATATLVTEGSDDVSCARFSSATTLECNLADLSGRLVWQLTENSGTTSIWFDESRRYELFIRRFVPDDVAVKMVADLMPLGDLEPATS